MSQDVHVEAAEAPHVNVLAYPAPTTGRYLLFIVAMLTSGMFVGWWMHNVVFGDEWFRWFAYCQATVPYADPGASLGETVARGEAARQCMAPSERVRALWSLAGAGVVAAISVIVLWLIPPVLRRRRHLAQPPQKYHEVISRFAELAREAGLRKPPELLIRPARASGDAFSFGVPGAHAVALPLKVVGMLQQQGAAEGIVRHEFAHLKHHDVELAWLARSVWYVLGPFLAVPVVGSLLLRDVSMLVPYLWRAALLAVIVELVAADLLRSREHNADLRAAGSGAHRQAVRAGIKLIKRSAPKGRVRRLLSRHPSAESRLHVLTAPELVARTGFVDALIATFLAALALPLIVAVMSPMFMTTGWTLPGQAASALLVGSLLGLTVGFSLWRSALMSTAAGPTEPDTDQGRLPSLDASSRRDTALGVVVGLTSGASVSLAQTGISWSGLDSPAWLAVPAVIGAGTVAVAHSLGVTWVPLVRMASHPWLGWVPALIVNAVLFSAATWIWSTLQFGLDQAGRQGTRGWLAGGSGGVLLSLTMLFLAATSLIAIVLSSKADRCSFPAWLYVQNTSPRSRTVDAESPDRMKVRTLLVAGAAAGAAGGLVIIGWLLSNAILTTPEAIGDMLSTATLICASTAGSCGLALSLTHPRSGPAAALPAGLVSVLVSLSWFLLFFFFRGVPFSIERVSVILQPALGTGLVFILVACTVAQFPRRPSRKRPHVMKYRAAIPSIVIATLTSLVVVGCQPSPDEIPIDGSTTASTAAPTSAAPTFSEAPPATASSSATAPTDIPAPAEAPEPVVTPPPALSPAPPPAPEPDPGLAEEEGYPPRALTYLDAYEEVNRQIGTALELANTDPSAAQEHLGTVVFPAITALRQTAAAYVPQAPAVASAHNDLLAALELTEQKMTLFSQGLTAQDPNLYAEAQELDAREMELLDQWAAKTGQLSQ